jgi:very-short-patch-repair endonuclease
MSTQNDTARADAVIGELAARQWGVVARRQLLAAGLTHAMVGERVRHGRLIALHRGVYAVGHRQLRREGYWLAAVLAVPGAVLSHRSAAALHDLRPVGAGKIDVTTTRGAVDRDRIRVHRTRTLDATDIATVERIPVTTIARTLVDLAGVVPSDHLTKAMREAERTNPLDAQAIERVLERTAGRRGPGHKATRAALAELEALATTLTRSSLEDAFLKLVRRAGLPRPRINALIEGMQVDASWEPQRLIVELDGWEHHRSKAAFEQDRTRDARLTAAGWRVVRFTHRQVADGTHVVEALRRLGLR